MTEAEQLKSLTKNEKRFLSQRVCGLCESPLDKPGCSATYKGKDKDMNENNKDKGQPTEGGQNDALVMPEVTKETISEVIISMASAFDDDLHNTAADKMNKKYWHFKWDDSASLEWNVYQFHDLLKLYGSFCRRWEEHHNGTCCVVERVRDKYLMPKIREFIDCMKREA